jgi:hypothetical protein
MTSSRVLIALLVAATVLVDLVVVACLGDPPRLATPTLPAIVMVALVFGQVNLLAAWVGLRRPASPWPWTCLVGFIVLCSLLLGADDGRDTTRLTLFPLMQAGFVIGSLWIVRLAGVTVVEGARDTASQDVAAPRKANQFTLAQLFGWMTGLAVCLGLLRCAINREDISEVLRELWHGGLFVSLYHAGNVAVVCLVLWGALGRRWPLARGLTLYLVFLVAITPIWISAFVHTLLPFSGVLALQALLILGSLWVVRMAGYRLTVRKKTSARSGVEIEGECDAMGTPDGNTTEAPKER